MKYLLQYPTEEDFQEIEDKRGAVDSVEPGTIVINENDDLVYYNQFGHFFTLKSTTPSPDSLSIVLGDKYEYDRGAKMFIIPNAQDLNTLYLPCSAYTESILRQMNVGDTVLGTLITSGVVTETVTKELPVPVYIIVDVFGDGKGLDFSLNREAGYYVYKSFVLSGVTASGTISPLPDVTSSYTILDIYDYGSAGGYFDGYLNSDTGTSWSLYYNGAFSVIADEEEAIFLNHTGNTFAEIASGYNIGDTITLNKFDYDDAMGSLSLNRTVSIGDTVFALPNNGISEIYAIVTGFNGQNIIVAAGGEAVELPYNSLLDIYEFENDGTYIVVYGGQYSIGDTVKVHLFTGCLDITSMSVGGEPPIVMANGEILHVGDSIEVAHGSKLCLSAVHDDYPDFEKEIIVRNDMEYDLEMPLLKVLLVDEYGDVLSAITDSNWTYDYNAMEALRTMEDSDISLDLSECPSDRVVDVSISGMYQTTGTPSNPDALFFGGQLNQKDYINFSFQRGDTFKIILKETAVDTSNWFRATNVDSKQAPMTLKFNGSGNTLRVYTPSDGRWTYLYNTNESSYTTTLPVGQDILFYGGYNNHYYTASTSFSCGVLCDVSGDIMSLYGGRKDVPEYGFYNFFSGWGVRNADNLILSSIRLANGCYSYMFSGCTSLTTAPELPATTLVQNCYDSMFQGCSSLTTAPELPATTLANNCYYGMFQGCTGLTAAPTVLPATTLATYCYQQMFSGCTSLTTAPAISATTLANGCCNSMFYNCRNLVDPPVLLANTLVNNCYSYMFARCTKLDHLVCLATEGIESGNSNTNYWLTGTTSTGEFYMASGATWVDTSVHGTRGWVRYAYGDFNNDNYTFTMGSITPSDAGAVFKLNGTTMSPGDTSQFKGGRILTAICEADEFELITEVFPLTQDLTYNATLKYCPIFKITNLESVSGSIKFTTNGGNPSLIPGKNIQYKPSTGSTWYSLWTSSPTTTTVTLPSNGYVMFRCSNTVTSGGSFNASGNYITISASTYHSVEGNINSLISKHAETATYGSAYTFMSLFLNDTKLQRADNLILNNEKIVLTNYCYQNMFRGCTSLATAPQLPATTLAYGCYQQMFSNCTSLTTAPQLPATTLVPYCYSSMFYGCSSLATAPQLPATTLATYCYSSMFQGCTSLTTAPELPATRLATYCYQQMFFNCNRLNYIKAMFTTTPGSNYTSSWVYGVATTGTFVKNSAATWTTTGTSGIPTGWTVETASS